MSQQSRWEKLFNYSIGCLGLVGVLATVIALLVTLAQPTKVVVWLQRYASLPTPTPIIITMPPTESSVVPVSDPASPPTHTPLPTYTPYPTHTALPAPTSTLPPSASPSPALALPFSDDFDDGARNEWEPLSGTWRTVDGEYTVTGSQFTWAHSVVGDPNWTDYVVDVDYSTEHSYTRIALLVRASESSGLGMACILSHLEVLHWAVWGEDGWETLATKKLPQQYQKAGHLRVEVRGSRYSCGDGSTKITLTDDSLERGAVGVGIHCRSDANCPLLDNFTVTSSED